MKSVEFTKPQEAISLFDGKPRMKDTLFNNFMAFEGNSLKNKPSPTKFWGDMKKLFTDDKTDKCMYDTDVGKKLVSLSWVWKASRRLLSAAALLHSYSDPTPSRSIRWSSL